MGGWGCIVGLMTVRFTLPWSFTRVKNPAAHFGSYSSCKRVGPLPGRKKTFAPNPLPACPPDRLTACPTDWLTD
eukprot:1185050-Prorocentrum_minimum.AAC.2